MNPSGLLVHDQGKRFNVGRQKLFQPPVLQNLIYYRMLVHKPLKNFFIGYKLLGLGYPCLIIELQPDKKYIAELLWRRDVKLCTGQGIDLLFKRYNVA